MEVSKSRLLEYTPRLIVIEGIFNFSARLTANASGESTISTLISNPDSALFKARLSKLEPPPEANTATLLTIYCNYLISSDFINHAARIIEVFQYIECRIRFFFWHDNNKADAHVEDIICFFLLHPALFEQPVEYFRHFSISNVDTHTQGTRPGSGPTF